MICNLNGKPIKLYMIQDKITGQYYKAGLVLRKGRGKIWSGIGPIRNALSCHFYHDEAAKHRFLMTVNIVEITIDAGNSKIIDI